MYLKFLPTISDISPEERALNLAEDKRFFIAREMEKRFSHQQELDRGRPPISKLMRKGLIDPTHG
jgi:hypothetical protein